MLKQVKRSPATISRELKRNIGKVCYRYKQAHKLACSRHKEKNKHIKLTNKVKYYIQQKLKLYWSPEQIAARLNLDKGISMATRNRLLLCFAKKSSKAEGFISIYATNTKNITNA